MSAITSTTSLSSGGLQPSPPPFNASRSLNAMSQTSNPTVTANITSIATATPMTTSDIISTTTTTPSSITPVPDPIAATEIASASALLASTTSRTQTNFILIISLGGTTIFLILLLSFISLIYIRRHRRNPRALTDTNTQPFASPKPQQTPSFAPITATQSAPQIPQQKYSTSPSMGSRNYSAQALASNPPSSRPPTRPSRPRRSISAPMLAPEFERQIVIPDRVQEIPVINIQPNTPSVYSRDRGFPPEESSLITPILQSQSGPRRVPRYHGAPRERGKEELARIEGQKMMQVLGRARGRVGEERLGLRNEEESRVSVDESYSGSEMEFIQNSRHERDRSRDVRTPALYSTRASSEVFPRF